MKTSENGNNEALQTHRTENWKTDVGGNGILEITPTGIILKGNKFPQPRYQDTKWKIRIEDDPIPLYPDEVITVDKKGQEPLVTIKITIDPSIHPLLKNGPCRYYLSQERIH